MTDIEEKKNDEVEEESDFADEIKTAVEETPAPEAKPEPEDTISDEPFMGVLVEHDPEFPGGIEALYKFIEDNMRYPPMAAENAIGGRVYVQFEVDTDGTVQYPYLLRDIGGGCGAEAIRIVKSMPKWKPGKQNGKPMRVQYNLPVVF